MELKETVQENELINSNVEVVYQRPKLFNRVMAEVIDLFLLFICFVPLLLAARGIVNATPLHRDTLNLVEKMRVDSCLYVKEGNKTVEVASYLKSSDDGGSYSYLKTQARSYIEGDGGEILGFLNYCKDGEYGSEELYNFVTEAYENYLLDDKYSISGEHFFVKDGDKIVENPALHETVEQKKYFEIYCNFLSNNGQTILASKFPTYKNAINKLTISVFAIELPAAYALSGIIVYFIPTLIFRRGRKTIGKLVYKIGVVDKHFLNISWKKNLARFAIFYFAIFLLSMVTLAIPLIISFSMKAFSKNKQSFTDYMLGLMEIDTNGRKIYNSYEEALVDQLPDYKKPVDFKPIIKE